MDWGSLSGLLLALAGIAASQLLEGGAGASLLQPSALLIVAVGTMGAILLQNGVATCIRALKLARRAFMPGRDSYPLLVHDLMFWSSVARREGLLALERYIDQTQDAFLARGLRLVVDGATSEHIRNQLEQDIDAWGESQQRAARVWEAAGGYAPTIGILGAVLGLIQVMGNLSDPARLGSGIAVAFVATIYGVGLANLLFLPVAHKLKAMIADDIFLREITLDALLGIAEGDNPRRIEECMSLYRRHP